MANSNEISLFRLIYARVRRLLYSMKRIGPSCVLLSIALILTGCRWGYSYSEFGYRMDRFLQTEESRDEKTPLADETSEEQEMKQSQT